MSTFFTLPASQRKRKRTEDSSAGLTKRRQVKRRERDSGEKKDIRKTARKNPRDDESISESESEDGSGQLDDASEASGSEATSEEGETAAERRARLAERYLANLREEVDETGFDAEEIDREIIARRLKDDVDQAKGRQLRQIASKLDFAAATHCLFRAETETTTAIAVHPPYVYTVSKDKVLAKWELMTPDQHIPPQTLPSKRPPRPHRKQPKRLAYVRGIRIKADQPRQHGHKAPIISVAASPCGLYVATGSSTDCRLIIWSASTLTPMKTFTTHRDAITGLCFAPQSSSQPGMGAQLFSASADRTIKTYSLSGTDSLAYVETLFGHQDHVLDIAALGVNQCVSVGARDRSARLWKVAEEMQSVFRADSSKHASFATGSVDCVAALPPAHFVTGADSGAIQLWSIHRKKPVFTVEAAHGVDEPEPLEDVSSEIGPEVLERLRRADGRRAVPRAITALTSVSGTDLVVSGSWDGVVRVWKLSEDRRSLLALGVVGQQPDPAPSLSPSPNHEILTNRHTTITKPDETSESPRPLVRGVINSLAAFERRRQIRNEYGGVKDGDTLGLCIVAATGKELRLGKWKKFAGGRNGAVLLEVPLNMRDGVGTGAEEQAGKGAGIVVNGTGLSST